MREVDIAIQLRAKNTGESSGVVPQLLSTNTIVVTSAVGALLDYGNAVRYVQSGCSPKDLVEIVFDEIDSYIGRTQSRTNYVMAHTPERFCEELFNIIDNNVSLTKVIKKTKSFKHCRAQTLMPEEGNEETSFGSSWDSIDPTPSTWSDFERIMNETGSSDDQYVKTHLRRYPIKPWSLERHGYLQY
jgi:hypothetical protein